MAMELPVTMCSARHRKISAHAAGTRLMADGPAWRCQMLIALQLMEPGMAAQSFALILTVQIHRNVLHAVTKIQSMALCALKSPRSIVKRLRDHGIMAQEVSAAIRL